MYIEQYGISRHQKLATNGFGGNGTMHGISGLYCNTARLLYT